MRTNEEAEDDTLEGFLDALARVFDRPARRDGPGPAKPGPGSRKPCNCTGARKPLGKLPRLR